ncbi:MAG TPA: GNAT family N-acetyltransferase [Allocoleopsis sp.]
MKLTIRHFRETDLDTLDRILIAAFATANSYKKQLQRYTAIQPEGWFVAELDRTVVGMVGAMDYSEFAYIGLMAVHPTVQRRGIGRALIETLLDWLDARGTNVTQLNATEAGAKLYALFGFVEDSKRLVFQRDRITPSPPSPSRVRSLFQEDLSALVAFDTPIFGANRRSVLAAYLCELPDRAFVTYDEVGQITGYLFVQPAILGPWAASTPETAEALLAIALQEPCDRVYRVLVPSTNHAAANLLERYGFIKQRELRHMRRGGSSAPHRLERLYGLASFAIG